MTRTNLLNRAILYLIIGTGAFCIAFPIYWMFALATHSTINIFSYPPPLGFGDQVVRNFTVLFDSISYARHMWNSVFVAAANVLLILIFCSMGGYAFAMYTFPGKRWMFALCLSTLMIPWIANIIPWFIVIREIGWVDNHLALIVPGAANAFGIFWMRQYISSAVHPQLLDQARVDGCHEWLIFFRVVAPTLTPAFSALGIFSFVTSWNNFIVPLIVLRSDRLLTLPLSLVQLTGDPRRGTDVAILMMAASLAILPIVIAFLISSRKFIAGMMAGAIKG